MIGSISQIEYTMQCGNMYNSILTSMFYIDPNDDTKNVYKFETPFKIFNCQAFVKFTIMVTDNQEFLSFILVENSEIKELSSSQYFDTNTICALIPVNHTENELNMMSIDIIQNVYELFHIYMEKMRQ
jgi:hypothetical protein